MDKLFSYAINEWLNDIKTNQLQGLLSGVAPIHTLVKLGKCSVQGIISDGLLYLLRTGLLLYLVLVGQLGCAT